MAVTHEVKVQSLIKKPVTFNDRLGTVIRQVSRICRTYLVDSSALGARELYENEQRLGEFRNNSEKRILPSSCLSVRTSVRMEQLGCHWTDRHESLYKFFFRKPV